MRLFSSVQVKIGSHLFAMFSIQFCSIQKSHSSLLFIQVSQVVQEYKPTENFVDPSQVELEVRTHKIPQKISSKTQTFEKQKNKVRKNNAPNREQTRMVARNGEIKWELAVNWTQRVIFRRHDPLLDLCFFFSARNQTNSRYFHLWYCWKKTIRFNHTSVLRLCA